MRTRLLVVLVALALAVVAAFAVPLLASTAQQRTQELVIARTGDVERFVVLAQQAVASHDPAGLAADANRYAELYGEAVVVVDAQRVPLVQAGLTAADPAVHALVEAAMRNEPGPHVDQIAPWTSTPAFFARPVGDGTHVSGAVVLRASVTTAAGDVARRWSTVVSGALLVAVLFVLLAVLLARWIVRPLHELEDGVLAVATGHRAEVPEHAGPRELRSLARSFNRMSDAVVEAADQQHRLVADASHQLRNPLAALRLRVDSLAAQVDGEGPTYQATVAEVERLENILDGLLALALADSTATRAAAVGDQGSCDLAAVVAERVDAWRPSAEQAGAKIVPPPGHDEPVTVRCPEGELAQILDVLLDNAVHYAGRGATITTDWATGDGTATLTVADDGPGMSTEDRERATERFWRAGGEGAPRGTGLGLAIALQQIRTRDGSLELRQAEPHGLEVRVTLPLAEVTA
ncbi:MAG TPA: HAMP domain-containing sensor histidine kinase [Amycolatopsis sp.]|nr:HAMP domain-containing sensor histidine kinase [Amycolatopsis sp.]